MQDSTIWVGLDAHKSSITAAILEGDESGAEVIKLSSDLNKVRRLFRRLSTRGPIRSCYEASGAGFVLHRALSDHGYSCEVVAPSLIPRKPGDRRTATDACVGHSLERPGALRMGVAEGRCAGRVRDWRGGIIDGATRHLRPCVRTTANEVRLLHIEEGAM